MAYTDDAVGQALKECVDEIDLGTQYHLSRYAFLCESVVHGEAIILQPPEENGTSSPLRRLLCDLQLPCSTWSQGNDGVRRQPG